MNFIMAYGKNESGEEITFDYEAKTISGKTTWLRRAITTIQNQSTFQTF